jgi:mannose-1-phosphate guanylyltransferase
MVRGRLKTEMNSRRRDELDTGSPSADGLAFDPAAYKTGETTIPLVSRPAGPVALRNRWGVVLAGGDGVRLSALVKLICGEERPKQFCPLFDGRSLLAQTLRRSELTIPREQLLVSLAEHHRKWYLQEAALPTDQTVVQPANRGTAPAVLHSVLSIAQIDENALVAILPADHHYSDESLFAAALESAFISAAEYPGAVVLLGAQPDYPETQYGWIELGAPVRQQGELFQVRAFQEKPSLEIARRLWSAQDSVWNTFVMVGRVKAFLDMLHAALPEVASVLATAPLWKGTETHIEHALYKRMPSADVSKQVLSTQTTRLLVLRLGDAGWSDLGDPERVMAMFAAGSAPVWMTEWRRTNGPAMATRGAAA